MRGHMKRNLFKAGFAFSLMAQVVLAQTAFAAEPIEGDWKTPRGAIAAIAPCGEQFCIILKTGKFTGRQVGKLSGIGANYKGEITDPETDKTYSGSAVINGSAMVLKGCVLSVLCKSQTWNKL